MRIAFGVACAAVLLNAVQSTPPPSATALIAGHVVDGSTGAPVTGAIVSLVPSPAGPSAIDSKLAQRAAVDTSGGFVFAGVPPGAYDVIATKPGYIDGRYGKRQPRGAPLSLDVKEGARAIDLSIRMWRFASIAGTLLDEANEPIVGIALELRRRTFLAGHLRLIDTGAGNDGTATTDDRGMYRFSTLVPGDYAVFTASTQTTLPAALMEEYSRNSSNPQLAAALLSASNNLSPIGSRDNQVMGDFVLQGSGRSLIGPAPGDSTMAVYRTTFFPDALAPADAGIVTVRSGELRTGIDLHLRPVPAVRVAGTLVGPDGPMPLTRLRLVPQSADDLASDQGMDTATTLTDRRGAFTFLGVPAGQYVVRLTKATLPVRPPGATPNTPLAVPDTPTRWLAEPVTVGDRDIELALALHDGYRVTGRFEFEGQKERPTAERLQQIPVVLEALDARGGASSPMPGHGDAAGGFSSYSVVPGRYFVRIGGAPPGWTVKSATLEGQDVTEKPFELRTSDITGLIITFTDLPPAEIRGSVRTLKGDPDIDVSVVVFPADKLAWMDFGINPPRLKSARPSSNGTYSISNLPAGDYFIAAVPEDASGGTSITGWDPKFFEAVGRAATRVRVTAGQKTSQDLQTAVIR